MAKTTIKIADLLQVQSSVEISEEQQIMVRSLTLHEMMGLLVEQTDNFVMLYSKGIAGELTVESLTEVLMFCPDLVAKIIAFAMDEHDAWETVQKKMPATVQLLALQTIWKVSVPDPKKFQELSSVVMALLQKLAVKGAEIQKSKQLKTSSLESSQQSSTLVTTDTV